MAKVLYHQLTVGDTITHKNRDYRVLARPVPATWSLKVSIAVHDLDARTDTTIKVSGNAEVLRRPRFL
ncbi:hypothetical protein ACFWIW_14015 [Amycolatopsis sp. NPDC058340]|uniref:hypothetical protein n=1 Tax=Amycolatopsis sp. NPDC058340 TaxID=3346453 RepID=UPI00364D3105